MQPEQALPYIQKPFRIEAGIKTATTDEKYRVRQQDSIPILAALKKWLDKSLKHPVKSAKLTKALTYLSNQWCKLSRYRGFANIPSKLTLGYFIIIHKL